MKIALALLGLFAAVALTLTGVALYGSLPPGALTGVDAFDPFDVLFPLALVSYLAVGMLIVWRRTRNAVGWIFCAIGALSALVAFAEGYSWRAELTDDGEVRVHVENPGHPLRSFREGNAADDAAWNSR